MQTFIKLTSTKNGQDIYFNVARIKSFYTYDFSDGITIVEEDGNFSTFVKETPEEIIDQIHLKQKMSVIEELEVRRSWELENDSREEEEDGIESVLFGDLDKAAAVLEDSDCEED